MTPVLLTHTGSQTSSGFSWIVDVHVVTKENKSNLYLIEKYQISFLCSQPKIFALNQKRGHKP